MKTVCCANMPFAAEAFSTLGETVVKDGRHIRADDAKDADVLAIRSTTRVNAALLDGSRVRFVGTATIGTDHMDIPWIEQRGIAWSFAAGCNANSVSEYVTAALLRLATRHGFDLRGLTLGVIGVGNVGARVVEKGLALGMRVLPNDPPRARAGECVKTADGQTPAFAPLETVLAESDIVTLHTPLTRDGADATFHLAGADFFARLKSGAIFINAARGAIADTDALLAARRAGRVRHLVVDCWEGEPAFRADLLAAADLATPHIAGHSYEGKVMGTVMVYRAACAALGLKPAWSMEGRWPAPLVPEIGLTVFDLPERALLDGIVRRVYDIEADDARLRALAGLPDDARAAGFDRLRREYPMRREFRFTRVYPGALAPAGVATLRGLDFAI